MFFRFVGCFQQFTGSRCQEEDETVVPILSNSLAQGFSSEKKKSLRLYSFPSLLSETGFEGVTICGYHNREDPGTRKKRRDLQRSCAISLLCIQEQRNCLLHPESTTNPVVMLSRAEPETIIIIHPSFKGYMNRPSLPYNLQTSR